MEKIRYTDNQKKAHDLNRHIFVTAGAGSGKTAVLVNRYLKILLEKELRVRNVVAITFTEKAAAEMRNRIAKKIDEMIENHGENDIRKLRDIKEQLTSANISTIHSFCSRILREFAVEARVDAGFRIVHGIEQKMLLSDIIEDTLKEVAMRDVNDHQRKELAFLLRVIGKDKLNKILVQLAEKRYEIELLRNELYSLSDSELIDFWNNFVANEFQRLLEHFSLNNLVEAFNSLLTVAEGKKTDEVSQLVENLESTSGYSQFTNAYDLANIVTTKSSGTIAKRDFIGSKANIAELESEIELICNFANEVKSLPIIAQSEQLLINVTRKIVEFYKLVMANYEKNKNQSGQLDFEDLQLKVKSLLEDSSISKRLAEKYPYIMIDEYQDTNKLQYNILKPLVENYRTGNLFIVGDPKQSIYGFRNADVRVFEFTKKEINDYQKELNIDFLWEDIPVRAEKNEQQGELHLADSFRSLRDIVAFVNFIFEYIMGLENNSEYDVDYEPLIKGRQNNEATGSVELILLPKKKPKKLLEPEIETESEYEIIAERVKHLIASGHEIWERLEGKEVARPIKYQDIAILLRSRGKLSELEFALEQAGIPFKVAGGIGFYQRQEIYDIYNYLQFLLNSHDDIALAGILRGPFFGISDAELYEISNYNIVENDNSTSGDTGLWAKLNEYIQEQPPNSLTFRAWNILNCHLQIADRVSVPILIRTIFTQTGAIGTISAGPKGTQALGNYEKLLGIARDFERSGFSNLFDFVEQLKILIDEEEREEQADIQFDKDAVQIMTVHAAKGLEFPVVFLPYANKQFNYDVEPFLDDALGIGLSPSDPENNYQKSEPAITEFIKERNRNKTIAEEKRNFYVAATRARDMLIISGEFPEQNRPSWMKWTCDALEIYEIPDESVIKKTASITNLNQTEEISDRSVEEFELSLKVIRKKSDIEEYTEIPEIEFEPKDSLELNIEPIVVETHGEVFSVSQLFTYSRCPARFYLQYQLDMPPLVNSDISNDTLIDYDDIEPEIDYWNDISEIYKGTVIHEILEKIRTPDLGEAVLDRFFSQYNEQYKDKIKLNREQIIYHVKNFINSDIAQKALSAEEQYHEVSINTRFGKNLIVGKIDLLFVNEYGQFEIVDYKTDFVKRATIENKAEEYRNQMSLYAWMVHKTTQQAEIELTLFFTGLAYPYKIHYDKDTFEKFEKYLEEMISGIESKNFGKNTQYCADCPYFTEKGCILK